MIVLVVEMVVLVGIVVDVVLVEVVRLILININSSTDTTGC